jgi:hypothetical protein
MAFADTPILCVQALVGTMIMTETCRVGRALGIRRPFGRVTGLHHFKPLRGPGAAAVEPVADERARDEQHGGTAAEEEGAGGLVRAGFALCEDQPDEQANERAGEPDDEVFAEGRWLHVSATTTGAPR